jgi:hypothetical protein
VPDSVQPREFGLWNIVRQDCSKPLDRYRAGFSSITALCRWTEATLHNGFGEVVMEDSREELRKHLPIWLAARGRVLVTGLGLGCVVRGLLAKPEVDHIDVVELDGAIIDVVGAEFAAEPRVTIHHHNALTFPVEGRSWDVAWHDIWCEGNSGLEMLHAKMIHHFDGACPQQGAWAFPRWASRVWDRRLLGAPKLP